MKVKLHVEGGGKGSSRHRLRAGIAAFIGSFTSKNGKTVRPKVVTLGPRDTAFDRFKEAFNYDSDYHHILLVDSEGPVNSSASASNHLHNRDGWNFEGIDGNTIHLMVQTMEAWLIADPESLKEYYGQHFRLNQIPTRSDVESIPKDNLEPSLKAASINTTKGEYHKIKHASAILQILDRNKVRRRAQHCNQFFIYLESVITQP